MVNVYNYNFGKLIMCTRHEPFIFLIWNGFIIQRARARAH